MNPSIPLDIPAFASFVLLSTFTPGPNNIMAMSNAVKYGFAGSMRFCFGVFWGFMGILTACAALCALLFAFIPAIEPGMRWVGAAYMVFLAWSVFRSAPPDQSAGNGGARASALRPESMLTGMLLQLVNVKVILYGITIFSSFVLPHYSGAAAIGSFSLLLAAVGFVSTCCWALFGSVFQRLFTRHAKALNLIMALLLAWCAAGLVLPL